MIQTGKKLRKAIRARTALVRKKAPVEETLAQVIPATFYSDRPLKDRVAKLVDIWRQAVLTNGALREQLEKVTWERDEARAALFHVKPNIMPANLVPDPKLG